MTTLSIPRCPAPPTTFERALLHVSASIAGFVSRRAQMRAAAKLRCSPLRVAASAVDARRRDVSALAHTGILPR